MTLKNLITTAAAAGVAVLAIATGPAGAATNDKPSAGRFTGTSSFDGPISLTFERRGSIGLHLGRYRVRGTQRCPSGEQIAIDEGGTVTARTSARVKPNRTFRLSTVVVKLDGRYTSSRRVEGKITIRTAACEQRGTFSATLRRR
jgi:hypothetical protein